MRTLRSVVVVDTSALMDTVQAGNDAWADAFAQVQARCDVVAPLRLAFEVGNIVHRKHPQAFGRDLEERQQVVREILEGVRIPDGDRASLARSGAIAERLGVTFYDATFLDVALETDGSVLLVQDRKLRDAARKALGKPRVLDLDDLVAAVARGAL